MPSITWMASDDVAIGTALSQVFAHHDHNVHILQTAQSACAWPESEPSCSPAVAEMPFPIARLEDGAATTHWLAQQETQTGPVALWLCVTTLKAVTPANDALQRLLVALHARMCQRRHGRIILILRSPQPGTDDCIGALRQLAHDLAQQALGQGVTVNLIFAGPAETRSTTFGTKPATIQAGQSLSSQPASAASPHLSQAEEIAHLALWLASDEAGPLTGAEFVINGPN